jgi:putative endonuclease
MKNFIYIIYSRQADRFYVGRSKNPWQRLEQHNNNKMEKYTGKYKDWELLAIFEVIVGSGDAEKIERFIKKQKSRKLILQLIIPTFMPDGELARLVRVPHLRD